MAEVIHARRTFAEITFDGEDITDWASRYLLSLTYTDNEEDGADDLELQFHDRSDAWLGKWLAEITEASSIPDSEAKAQMEETRTKIEAENAVEEKALSAQGTYYVTAKSGLNVRDGRGTDHDILGTLEYGKSVEVSRIDNGWAKISYSGGDAFVSANYLSNKKPSPSKKTSSKSSASSSSSASSGGGRTVKAQFTAYGPFMDEGGPRASNGEWLNPSAMTCAAPSCIPFGTKIIVQGTGTSRDGQIYRVNDRGGAINVSGGVYHFDLLMSSKSECYNFGRRNGAAVILDGSSSSNSKSGQSTQSNQSVSLYMGGEGNTDSATEQKETAQDDTGKAGLEVPGKLKIEAVIKRQNWTKEGATDQLACGSFELADTTVEGPPMKVTLNATSLPFTSGMRQTERCKSWEKCKLSEIAGRMASDAGLVLMYDSENDPEYSCVDQYKTSDIEFLSTLCHRAGLALKAANKMIVIFDQDAYEKKDPILTIKPRNGLYTDFSLQRSTADTQCTACRVSYTLPSGEAVEGMAYSSDYDASQDHKQLEITAKVENVAEAQALAEKELKLHNKYERNASFTFPGNPYIAAGETVALNGWGPWDGKYVIKQAKHTLDESGYVTEISLRWAHEMIVEKEGIEPKEESSAEDPEEESDAEEYNDVEYVTWEDSETGTSGSSGGGTSSSAENMIAEAKKYIGKPYVWGGSSPSTSFDCSGFVCWAINHSGGANVGRTTAQGLYNLSKKISRSEARRGDIIFFTKTYSTSDAVTHVGIYMGDGQMLHCGNPIGFANINSSYWTSHFYGFGRIV